MISHNRDERAGEGISSYLGNLREDIILGVIAIVCEISIQKDGVIISPVFGYIVQSIGEIVILD